MTRDRHLPFLLLLFLIFKNRSGKVMPYNLIGLGMFYGILHHFHSAYFFAMKEKFAFVLVRIQRNLIDILGFIEVHIKIFDFGYAVA